MDEKERKELTAALLDIRKRRNEASPDYRSDTYRADRASGTTSADIDLINEAYSHLEGFAQLVLQVHEDVWTDFSYGERCGVCGNTDAQSAAIGYDCAEEC